MRFYRGLTGLVEPLGGLLLQVGAREESAELHAERLGRGPLAPVRTWWHAASLGEVAALEPVLARAQAQTLAGEFAVTTTTVAGRMAARERWGTRATLAPLDLPGTAARVLAARRPRSLVLVETELWPNWLEEAFARGIRVGIVNGRISDRSWPRYHRFRPLFRPLMKRVDAVAARYPRDAERFLALGVNPARIRVAGNTKHDHLVAGAPAALPWGDGWVWTVGSLRPDEDAPVLDAFVRLQDRFPALRLVLALRHPAAWPRLAEDLRGRGLAAAWRSRPQPADAAARVLVADTHGELPALYAASRAVLVGGTLSPVGGHNPVEPALAGAPVIVGLHTANVTEEVEALLDGGGGCRVTDAESLTQVLETWLADDGEARRAGERALGVANALRGASDRSLQWLTERGVLEPETNRG
jgi:3-deoxy-D-manno-octulosonic-acid transferase